MLVNSTETVEQFGDQDAITNSPSVTRDVGAPSDTYLGPLDNVAAAEEFSSQSFRNS